jgi:micrococcal nuclease
MSAGHGNHQELPKQIKWIIAVILFAVFVEFFPQQKEVNINLAAVDTQTQNTDGSISPQEYLVVKAVDGDTIDIMAGEQKVRVRLIGVDTPESVDSRQEVQCFARESSEYTNSVAKGEKIRLEKDLSQGEADKYGRLLAYVYLPNGEMLNRKLIANGYGMEYTYQAPYKYQKEFKSLEDFAKREGRGLWADNAFK